MSFATYFKLVRKEKHLTQNQFAEAINACNSAVRNIEAGRTASPQYEIFSNLAKFLSLSEEEVAYNVFFSKEDMYDHPISPLAAHYLASRYTKRMVIFPARAVLDTEGNAIDTEGVIYKTGYPLYRILLTNIPKEKYLSAIRSKDKSDRLMKLVFSETLPFDKISEMEYIKEIRFLLDARNSDERMIFNELKKISISNLGNIFDIGYFLYDPEKDINGVDPEKTYVTNKRSIKDY